MAYVAVDLNGKEYIYQNKPVKVGTHWCSFDMGFVQLEKGSINRLIGRSLTWNSEPVELTIVKDDEFTIRVCTLSNNCDIDLLQTKTRKTDVVNARQIIIAYRKVILKLTLAQASAPFKLDHATALHCIRKVQEKSLNKMYYSQFEEVLKEYPDILKYTVSQPKIP